MKRTAIVWFRQDLRLHDNEALHNALRMADEVIPIYVFDPRVFKSETKFGFPKTGKYRTKFIIESIENLRQNFKELGGNLVVREGKPEEIIIEIAREYKASWVMCNRERTEEEVNVQDSLEKNLWGIGAELQYTRGKMLYYTQDLPMPVNHTPDLFTQFRKENELVTPVRTPLPTPAVLPALPSSLYEGVIPSLATYGIENFESHKNAVIEFKGGETEGLKRLRYYLWEKDLVSTYKLTRNGLIGGDFSTKFSPWLSQGCLSPKMIYHELKRYERERVANDSTYWVFFELLWRDFFRLLGKKYGNNIFQIGGTQDKEMTHLKEDPKIFEKWAMGNTGVPFVDANMRELNETGFMSNRGRQNVASFLVKDLKINWLIGAEYFESLLLDYDPCSNYGNWTYVAGVGSDAREDRYFNILSQATTYDSNGDYVRLWCPELANLPDARVHRPDLWSDKEIKEFNLEKYPSAALVDIGKWAR